MPFIPYIVAVLILFIVLKVLSMPMKIIIKFLVNAVIGGIVIYVLNLFGVGMTLNWISSLIVGFLGVPRSNNSCNFTVCISCIIKRVLFVNKSN